MRVRDAWKKFKKKKNFKCGVIAQVAWVEVVVGSEKTKAKLGHSVLWDTLYLQTSFVFLKVRVNS